MKSTSWIKYPLLLATLVGCATAPMTREQKEQQALSKAYETITSNRGGSDAKK